MVQITWDSPRELEEYISKLQGAAERLTSENRRLRKCHGTLIDKVCVYVYVCVICEYAMGHANAICDTQIRYGPRECDMRIVSHARLAKGEEKSGNLPLLFWFAEFGIILCRHVKGSCMCRFW